MNQFTNHQTSGDDCRESGEGETMREQFEKWTKMFGGKPDLTRANGGANYADSFIDIAWLAWKASRAAIEIEPLEGMTSREALDKGHMVDYANGYHDAIYAYEARLKAAGITFKE